MSPDAELTLLAFALARGSVAKVLQALSSISNHLETKYKASSLIVSMASVRLRLLYRNGNVTESKPNHTPGEELVTCTEDDRHTSAVLSRNKTMISGFHVSSQGSPSSCTCRPVMSKAKRRNRDRRTC